MRRRAAHFENLLVAAVRARALCGRRAVGEEDWNRVEQFVLAPADFAGLGSPWLGQLTFYAAATLPAFVLAWTIWRVFEAPILRLKERFPY